MESGCSTFSWIKELKEVDEKRFKAVCHGIREDGAYIEAGENDNVIVQKLVANPTALGVFGYSFLEENLNKLKGASIEGVSPDLREHRRRQVSGLTRPLHLREEGSRRRHPGPEEFVQEYTSDKAFGAEGYLVDKGLIPLPASDAKKVRADATCDEEPQALKTPGRWRTRPPPVVQLRAAMTTTSETSRITLNGTTTESRKERHS